MLVVPFIFVVNKFYCVTRSYLKANVLSEEKWPTVHPYIVQNKCSNHGYGSLNRTNCISFGFFCVPVYGSQHIMRIHNPYLLVKGAQRDKSPSNRNCVFPRHNAESSWM